MGVLMEVVAHGHPSRPAKEACNEAEMPDQLWDLISRFWLADTAERPDITYAIQVIDKITF